MGIAAFAVCEIIKSSARNEKLPLLRLDLFVPANPKE